MGVEDHANFIAFLKVAPDQVIFNYFHSAYTAHVLDLVNTAMAAVVVHEYFVHLAAELRTWKLLLEGRFMPARMAVIVIRYAWIGAFINCEIFMHGSPAPHNCVLHFRLVYGLYCILWAFSGSIFLMRLNIIFSRQKAIMGAYILLWLIGLACWIFVVTRLGAEPLPSTLHAPYGPKCVTQRFPRIGALGWAASILFDCCVFLGTLYRFHVTARSQDKTTQLRSRKWLFRSNLYYFGSSCFFNIACFLSSLFVNDTILSQIMTPIAFAMHTVTASRLVFNAKGWARGDALGDEDDVFLNTFNKQRRANPPGRITYTVDETVVTSACGAESYKQAQTDGEEGSSNACDDEEKFSNSHSRQSAPIDDGITSSNHLLTATPSQRRKAVPRNPADDQDNHLDLPSSQSTDSVGPMVQPAYDNSTMCTPLPPSYSSDACIRYGADSQSRWSSSQRRPHPYSNVSSPPRSPRSPLPSGANLQHPSVPRRGSALELPTASQSKHLRGAESSATATLNRHDSSLSRDGASAAPTLVQSISPAPSPKSLGDNNVFRDGDGDGLFHAK